MFVYKAVVNDVVDGDTIDIHIDLGFDVWTRQRLRLRGIDAAERATPFGKATKTWLVSQLDCASVTVRTYRPDKYGRYLADVWLSNPLVDGESVNDQMIALGIAKAYNGDTRSGLWAPEELQKSAIEARLR